MYNFFRTTKVKELHVKGPVVKLKDFIIFFFF